MLLCITLIVWFIYSAIMGIFYAEDKMEDSLERDELTYTFWYIIGVLFWWAIIARDSYKKYHSPIRG